MAMQRLAEDVRTAGRSGADVPGAGPPDDAQLMEAIAEGDIRAFETLYDRYSAQAYGLALRVSRSRQIAEESVQEAFLSLWNRPWSYRPGSGSVTAYLLRIVHNRAVDAVRHEEALRRRALAAEHVRQEMDDGDLTELAWTAVRRKEVRASLQLLSDLQREALELAYFGGLSIPEVARTLGIPLGTAKTRVRDGMIRLRSLLSPACVANTEDLRGSPATAHKPSLCE
jgi:RNA polymerase sigma-70 factor, ECF subfamily